jgi:hypothetical protein
MTPEMPKPMRAIAQQREHLVNSRERAVVYSLLGFFFLGCGLYLLFAPLPPHKIPTHDGWGDINFSMREIFGPVLGSSSLLLSIISFVAALRRIRVVRRKRSVPSQDELS